MVTFIAKHQTYGVHLGQRAEDGFFQTVPSPFGAEMIDTPIYRIYQNAFGRTVLVQTLSANRTGSTLSYTLYEKYGPTVMQVQTAPYAITTHLDFLWIADNCPSSLYTLLTKAGMPDGYLEKEDYSKVYWTNLYFDTVDGYRYCIRVWMGDWLTIESIQTPDGSIIKGEDVSTFANQIKVAYCCILAVLTIALLCLIFIPSYIRKRKSASNENSVLSEKPIDKRKIIRNAVCILIAMFVILGFIAKYHTYGVHVGTEFNFQKQSQVTYRSQQDTVTSFNVLIYQNAFGRNVVVRRLSTQPELNRQIYETIGMVTLDVQTFPDDQATHLDFFNMQKAICPITSLVKRAGAPESEVPGNFLEHKFVTSDQYAYIVRVDTDGIAWVTRIVDPNGNVLSDSEMEQLRNGVLFFYLALAAVLSVILVRLLVIPNKIRTRKQTA